MRIKKFVAPSVAKGLAMIKAEFGENAIILGRNKIKDPAHPEWTDAIEITAAIDKQEDSKAATYSRPSFVKTLKHEMPSEDEKVADKNEFGMLQKEVENLSSRMEEVLSQMQHAEIPQLPKPLQRRINTLKKNGVNDALANELVEKVFINLSSEEYFQADEIDAKLLARVKSRIKVTGPLKFKKNKAFVLPIIGPTGVGKTTTIAKLAAIYQYKYNKKTAIISADSFRIGAIEQLKAFADISNISFAAAYEAKELPQAIKKFSDYDLILIDTAGLNPRSMKAMVELKETLLACKPDDIYLSLSLTTRSYDIMNLIRNFSVMPFSALLFTKLDETSFYGDLLNLTQEFDIPIAYMTNGQNIPDDIMLAERSEIARYILKQKGDNDELS